MKIQIKDDEKKQGTVMTLSLKRDGDSVQIKASDERGALYTIGVFSDDGLYICNGISEKTGWPLNSAGQLKVERG